MKIAFGTIVLMGILCLGFLLRNNDNRRLVWADEFDYVGLPDSTKWQFATGGHGWGNNELQFYTDKRLKNASVQNGVLSISAHREAYKSNQYTSARLVTKNNGDWQYGTIEVRAKLPEGLGTWPAIWMLPTLNRRLNWPLDGEIDIMEHVGYNQGVVYGTIHTEKFNHMIGTQKSDSIIVTDAASAFHTYRIDWDQEKITWSVDEIDFLTLEKANEDEKGWPFDKPFHLVLNLAVGGNWGGKMGVDKNIWPQQMVIDYVRVYQ